MISSCTEILQLTEREHTNTHSPSSSSPHHTTMSNENATCGDISSTTDDPSDEYETEDSSNDEALAHESTYSEVCNDGDTNVQDQSTVKRSLFESSSSSNVPLDGNASSKISEGVMTRSSTAVVQMMELSPVLLSLKDHLTEVEHSWVELHADVTAAQQMLHQVRKDNFTRITTIPALSAVCLLPSSKMWFYLLICFAQCAIPILI